MGFLKSGQTGFGKGEGCGEGLGKDWKGGCGLERGVGDGLKRPSILQSNPFENPIYAPDSLKDLLCGELGMTDCI